MIEIKKLNKSFEKTHVLINVDAVFETGKINVVIGSSGSGKSVMMKCLVGLVKPDSGKIVYHGREFSTDNYREMKAVRKEIGMLFQSAALFDSLNVEENVAFPLKMFSDMQPKEIQKQVDFCLERVNLEKSNKLYPSELSGGMKKRVGIARSIALNPKYLFVDEPNSGLDPSTSKVIDHLIRDITLEYNITTIMNSHDMNSVFQVGDTVLYLHKGKNWWAGTPDEIKTCDNQELKDFVFAAEFTRQLQQNDEWKR